MSTSPLLSVEGLSLQFGGVKPLDNVSFDVEAGEITALIGPNGAGKTSVFNCLSGVYHPTAGTITLDGHEYHKMAANRAARLGLSRTFQTPTLFSGLTVLENLMAARYLFGKSGLLSAVFNLPQIRRDEVEHRRRAEEVVELLDLSTIRYHNVDDLSYGVRKRVELGRAICQDPKLLLLDEPMAGMTLDEKEDMSECIKDVCESTDATILLIEHDMGVVMNLASHIIVLDFGRKIGDGSPAEIRRNEAVISAYLGSDGNDDVREGVQL